MISLSKEVGTEAFCHVSMHVGTSDHGDGPSVLVTWTRIGNREVLVVATCQQCSIIQERLVEDSPDVGGRAMLVGTDALTTAGCAHAEANTSTHCR